MSASSNFTLEPPGVVCDDISVRLLSWTEAVVMLHGSDARVSWFSLFDNCRLLSLSFLVINSHCNTKYRCYCMHTHKNRSFSECNYVLLVLLMERNSFNFNNLTPLIFILLLLCKLGWIRTQGWIGTKIDNLQNERSLNAF